MREGRKVLTIPDQAMSIQEIVKRYVRNLPVDVIQREGVYLDQSEFDFEKMSRADFGEKARMADEFAARAADVEAEYNERVTEEREKQEAAKKSAKSRDERGAGIDSLDNTMPDDTSLGSNKLGAKKGKGSVSSDSGN